MFGKNKYNHNTPDIHRENKKQQKILAVVYFVLALGIINVVLYLLTNY